MSYKFTSQFLFILILSVILVWPLGLVLGFEPVTVTITGPTDGASFDVDKNINFSATANGGTSPYSFVWDFGDSTTLAGPAVTKSYGANGAKTVTVTASDFEGVREAASITLNIQAIVPPPTALVVTINQPAASATFLVGQDINFSVSASGGTPPYSFVWDFGDSTTLAGPAVVKSYTATGTKTVIAKGTDFAGVNQSQTISLNIAPIVPTATTTDPLTISNIRVTDVTYNSAIVHWTTNRVASSRVIYDVVSHSSITGQTAPNFGYASSTATTDVDTKVIEHSVSVTGLLPSTAYYFRVISQ